MQSRRKSAQQLKRLKKMTKYKFLVKSKGIYGFVINGHSGYAESGSDIVCAAVSSAAYMVANTITDVLGVKADIVEADACFSLKLQEKDIDKCGVLLKGLQLHLDELCTQYPEHITSGE